MPTRRVLAIGLDGYELSLAESLLCEDLLPNMRRIRDGSARFLLEHGPDKYSGLTWEQLSTGKVPGAGGRWSAVTFNPATYRLSQDLTSLPPFFGSLSARTVVFDLPYCDLSQAPAVRGITAWGSHDAGVRSASRPEGLLEEMTQRFGPYPGRDHIYGFVWQSAAQTRIAADALEKAVKVRADAARWLLRERIQDWDLGIIVVSEPHSAVEPMWHGVDAAHPLHGLPSASSAQEGLHRIYSAIDDLIGTLAAEFSDATVLLFAMHGMGANSADVAGMVLLGELLYRHNFGKPYLRDLVWETTTPQGVPLLGEHQNWHDAMFQAVPIAVPPSNLHWMPVTWYRHLWPLMKAFALPAFYDGRIRINLKGREAMGVVPLDRYETTQAELVELLHACRDALSGESVIDRIEKPAKPPHEIGPTEADLRVHWRGAPLGLTHPNHGRIGPFPYRRTGGHTGRWGFAYLAGAEFAPGDRGIANSMDVVPTIIDLLDELPSGVSGRSLLGRAKETAR